jgi:hypothetical protein
VHVGGGGAGWVHVGGLGGCIWAGLGRCIWAGLGGCMWEGRSTCGGLSLAQCIFVFQSGDVQPGTTLTFTIIPVHDESYNIDYEPVSSMWQLWGRGPLSIDSEPVGEGGGDLSGPLACRGSWERLFSP